MKNRFKLLILAAIASPLQAAQVLVRQINDSPIAVNFEFGNTTRANFYQILANEMGVPVENIKIVNSGAIWPKDDNYDAVNDLMKESALVVLRSGPEPAVETPVITSEPILVRSEIATIKLFLRELSGKTHIVECPEVATGDFLYTLVSGKTEIPKDEIRLLLGDKIIPNGSNGFLPIKEYQLHGGLKLVRRRATTKEAEKTAAPKEPAPTAPVLMIDPSKIRTIKIFGAGVNHPFEIIPDLTTNSVLFSLVSSLTGYDSSDLTIRIGGFPVKNDNNLIGEVENNITITVGIKNGAKKKSSLADESAAAEEPAAASPRLASADANNLSKVEAFLHEEQDKSYEFLINTNFENKLKIAIKE